MSNKLDAKAMECYTKNSMPYKIEAVDDLAGTVTTYIGYANGNPDDSEAGFAIMRIIETDDDAGTVSTTITFPEGSFKFAFIWNDRASLTDYSPFSNQ